MSFILLLILVLVSVHSQQCGTYISPCISKLNKVYEFIGPSIGPMEKLVTNLNFYGEDACNEITITFVTTAILTQQDDPNSCEENFESYHVEYTSLSFVAHNTTHFPFYKIRCNKEVEEGHVYNILANEIECMQDGKSLFDDFKSHVPSSEDLCFNVNGVDFYARKNGTRNVRISNAGCTDMDTSKDFEEL